MTPSPDNEGEQAAVQMAAATDRLREQARVLGRGAPAVPAPRKEPAADTPSVSTEGDADATFATVTHPGCAVVVVRGEVDIRTAAAMRGHLLEVLDAGHVNLIVDLSAVDFMDSSGLSVLVGVLRAVRPAGGYVRVVATSRHLDQLFQITGVHKILPLYPTVEAAAR